MTRAPEERRRWRRLKVMLIAVAVLAVVVRIALGMALPRILDAIAQTYGLRCRYERLELSLLAGDVELWHLAVMPSDGGAPYLEQEYFRAHLSIGSLLLGKVVVRRLEVDGLDLDLERGQDGELELLARVRAALAPDAAPPAPARPPSDHLDLAPPVRIDALRLQHVHVHLRDASVAPPFETRLELDLRLSDLGAEQRPARFELELRAPPLLDVLRVDGEGKSGLRELEARLEVAARGVHLAPALVYLVPLGLRPAAHELSFQSRMRVQARPVDHDARSVRLSGAIEQTALLADREEALAIDRVTLEADRVGLDGASLRAAVTGVRGRLTRLATQALSVAGIELAPAAPRHGMVEPARMPPATSATTYPVQLNALSVSGVAATLCDEAVEPHARFELALAELALGAMAVGDPAPATIAARMSVPGVIETLDLAGTATPFAPQSALDLRLAASGVTLTPLAAYLAPAHIEPLLERGSLECRLQAEVAAGADGLMAHARLSDVTLRAGETHLFDLPLVEVGGLHVAADGSAIEIGLVSLRGPTLPIERDPQGRLAALGLRLGDAASAPVEEQPAAVPEASAPERPAQPRARPRIALRKLRWCDAHLDLLDRSVSPPARLAIENLGVDLDDVVLEADANQTPQPGRVRASLALPGVAEQIALEGTVVADARAPACALRLTCRGITAVALAPRLARAGIEPMLSSASLELRVDGSMQLEDGARHGSLALRDVRCTDQGDELWGVDAVVLDGLAFASDGIKVHALSVERPRVVLARDASGAAIVSRLRMTGAAASDAVPRPAAAAPSPERGSPPPVLQIERCTITAAELDWSDAFVTPAVRTRLESTIELGPLVLGRDAPATPVSVRLHARDLIDELTLRGSFSAAASEPGVALELRARGLCATPLAPYLPSGIETTLRDGTLQAQLEARLRSQPEGGHSARVVISDVDFRERASDAALLQIGAIKALIARFDPEQALTIDELAVEAVEADVVRTASGATRALGLLVRPVAAAPLPAPPPLPAPAPPPESPPARVPAITVAKLALELRRIGLRDERGTQPLQLSARVINKAPWHLSSDDPESDPPAELELRAQAAPLVDSLVLDARIAPFAAQPSLELGLDVSGIHLDRLGEVLPALRDRIDGAQLDDGRLRAQLAVLLRLSRRHVLDFDLAKGFGLDLELKAAELRNGADGPVLAGVDDIHADVKRIDLGSGAVVANLIEIMKPTALVQQEKDGLRVAGLLLKRAAPAEVAARSTPASAAGGSDPAAPPETEVRIDRLLVAGIDARYEDRTCDPVLVVPLTDLEVDVRQITTLALREHRPMPFSILVRGGLVPLPKAPSGGLLGGVLGDALSLVQGSGGAREIEPRNLFEEISVKGRLALFPRPAGSVKASLSGFELAAFKGLLARANVTLDAGVLDGGAAVALAPDGATQADTRLVFTDLSLSEPPDGPIFRYLHLPAPLDSVLFVLRDQNQAITLPLSIDVGKDGMSAARIAEVAITTLGSLIARAIASAPLRAASTVTGTVESLVPFSLGGGEAKLDPGVIELEPGATRVSADALAPWRKIIDRLRDDDQAMVTLEHAFGGGDLALAKLRSNPPRDDRLRFLAELRRERAAVEHVRTEVASQARAALLSGLDDEGDRLGRRLREAEQRLGLIDQSLERVYEMLGAGAERSAARRARDAALDLARLRLVAARAALIEAVPAARARIRISEPRFGEAIGDRGGTITATAGRSQAP